MRWAAQPNINTSGRGCPPVYAPAKIRLHLVAAPRHTDFLDHSFKEKTYSMAPSDRSRMPLPSLGSIILLQWSGPRRRQRACGDLRNAGVRGVTGRTAEAYEGRPIWRNRKGRRWSRHGPVDFPRWFEVHGVSENEMSNVSGWEAICAFSSCVRMGCALTLTARCTPQQIPAAST